MFGERGHISEGPRDFISRKRRNIALPTRRLGITGQITDLLTRVSVCPLSEVVFLPEYLIWSEIASKRLDSKEVKDALDLRGAVINTWTIHNFRDFYARENTVLVWSARSNDLLYNTYYTHEESLNIVRELLTFQLRDSLNYFKQSLLNILECSVPKLNCICIVSPPSAGKNFYFDGVRDYFLNTGQMCNPNKTNHVAYQDCYNKMLGK
ncbi:hypothetical protein HHI36_000784 [Cryptolaemus montrouzieri]|uniref:Uncharacterized protein n=1 Tax=Cryptolaemus montrouzieri TaxID=559131 RepID=A0ABD2P5X3_9CUCU